MLTSPDFRELLKLFDEHEVRYLIVGGYAVTGVSKHAAGRPQDLLDLEALEEDS